jgi:hypothetical protein
MSGIAAAVVIGAFVASAAVAQAPPMAQGQAQEPSIATLLHLRTDQMAAYRALDAARSESPTVVAALRAKAQRLPSETTPQRLDFQLETLNIQMAHAHRFVDAERKFYAILTPDQQHTFDQLTAPRPQQGAPQR